MTGDTTPISDEARQAAAKALLDEGGGPGNGLHSWRCEYPDRYGPCDCVQEVADLILAAAAPLLVSADSSAQAERLRRERDRWEDEAKGWERHLIAAEVVVEGLRAELAETTRFKDVLHGIVRTVARIVHRSPNDDGGYAYTEVPQMVERELAALRAELANEVELRKSYQREVAALRAAGGQEKPVCPLTEAGIEHRPHHYLTPVPWDCPGLPAAPVGGQAEPSDGPPSWDHVMELIDRLRAAAPVGGQEKPNDATPQLANCTTCGATDAECRTVMGQTGAVRSCCARCKMTDTHPAAPVGGQAEPSDAQIDALFADSWDADDLAEHERVRAAGGSASDQRRAVYRRRLAAAAVSGEHQDATKDAQ